MNISMEVIPADDWKKDFSEALHRLVFNAVKPGEWDRIDYALLLLDEDKNTPCGYATMREIDARAVYIQFGGMLPVYQKAGFGVKCFKAVMDFARAKYEFVSMKIENTNFPMLKLAMKEDLKIVGASLLRGSLMLEHVLEVKKEIQNG